MAWKARALVFLENLLVIATLVALAYWYTYPGSEALFDGRTDTFMSDGTDPTATSQLYDSILQVWEKFPSRFLYGSIYTEMIDPERGTAFVVPWNERWLALASSWFVPLEQIYSSIVFALLIVNGLCMFWLTSFLRWPRAIRYGLTIAWAFNPFTRARAKVHGAMAGIYHLPLIFLALYLIVRRQDKRSLLIASLLLFLAGTTAHYFLVTCVFISPLFVLFLCLQPEARAAWKRITLRLVIALIPLMLMLGFNFLHMVPNDAKTSSTDVKEFAVTQDGSDHPFLRIYYAHPIDFISGDLAMDQTGADINPLRKMINDDILANLGMNNPHERTNGIRWSILLITLIAAVMLFKGKYKSEPHVQRNLLFFFLFATITFLLASSPDFPIENWGLSAILHRFMPKIRVANRAAIMVHFALLMVAGYWLANQKKLAKYLWIFPLLMIVDYYPAQSVPMAPILPRFQALQRDQGPCGTGMAFPFLTPYSGLAPMDMVYFGQRLRGSDCQHLDSMTNIKRVIWLNQKFPATREFVQSLSTSTMPADNLERLANCVPLNWIYFIEAVPSEWAINMCRRLGWTLYPDRICVAPKKDRPLRTYPDECALL